MATEGVKRLTDTNTRTDNFVIKILRTIPRAKFHKILPGAFLSAAVWGGQWGWPHLGGKNFG